MASENGKIEQVDSSTRPWLSIIIPAYNEVRYLPACMASIEPGSHPDVEVVLVDDGSTDGTSAICDAYAEEYSNVTVIHQKNSGSQAARNAGCLRAAGTWFWFVDSDDLISPYALEILRSLAASTSSELIHIEFVQFSDEGGPAWPAPMLFENPTRVAASDFIAGLYRGRYQHYMPSFLMRADSLLSGHGQLFCEDFSLYEDVVSVEEILRRVGFIEDCSWRLYGYRQAAGSMTHRRSNKASESGIRAVRELQKYDVEPDLATDKIRMETSLLFTAYRIAECGSEGDVLRQQARREIESRVREIGLLRLGKWRLVRYVLLESGLMDKIIDWRNRG